MNEFIKKVEDKNILPFEELENGMYIVLTGGREFVLELFEEDQVKAYLDPKGTAKRVEKPKKTR